MQLLKDRIRKDGIVREGGVLKVDSFLNHQMDIELFEEIGKEFRRRFEGEEINKILTIEASGIGIACIVAQYFHVPVVFVKKTKTKNIAGDVYTSRVESYTHGRVYDIIVSKDFLGPEDKVLLIDDFLANGKALEGLAQLVQDAGAKMVAMDIDAAGLPFLKNLNPPAGSKTVEQLSEIVNAAGIPFIVKGIMTVAGAKKAFDAGASAIIVSNHGGRVLDQTPATAEVLERIVEWNQGRMKIFVDGGIRQGTDIFKALAMGADAVLIARPFVQAVYGGAEEGVKLYIEKLAAELADTMAMCGAASIKDINRSMLYRPM